MKAISYIRVSTKSQGRSGLGLEAQRELIDRFLSSEDGELIQEYVECVSGAKNDRKILNEAILHAKRIGGVLVIAKLDRISRSVSFISSLLESGINFRIAEMPTATHFQIHIYAALAAEERRMISERTKAALKAARARGTVLGSYSAVLSVENRQRATEFANHVKEEILSYRSKGFSYRKIADALNECGITSFEGKGWYPATVLRAHRRLIAA